MIRLLSPVLDLALSAGALASGVLERETPATPVARMARPGEAAPRRLRAEP